MKKLLTLMAVAVSALGSALGATTGSYEGAAASLGSLTAAEKTDSVTLTKEYDPDDGTYDPDSGVYYYKFTLKKGETCSIYIDNLGGEFMGLSVGTSWDDEHAPYASFSMYYREDAVLAVLTAEDWDEEDTKGTFYICVDGDVGDTCTLHYTSTVIDGEEWEGREPPPAPGTQGNPVSITPTEKGETSNNSLIEGEFYYTFKTEANRAYRFRTTKGTEVTPFDINWDDWTGSLSDLEFVNDLTHTNDDYNASVEFRTKSAGTLTIYVMGEYGTFDLYFQKVPCRTIDEHDALLLCSTNDFSDTFVPGRLSALSNCWDHIIDEKLFKIDLEASQRCVFEVTGSTTNLMMRTYDKTGKLLGENTGFGGGDLNPYLPLQASAKGTYYVGVCQKDLEVVFPPSADPVTIRATIVPDSQQGVPDLWDDADDEIDGATEIEAVISNDSTDPRLAEGHGDHQLALSDWYDCFELECQKGITYKFATSTEANTSRSLTGEVFTYDSAKNKETRVAQGKLSADGIEFKASASQTYYLRVTVGEGLGREYPAYKLHTIAYVPNQKLGRLTVNIKGATSATWTYQNSLGADKTARKGGEKVLTWGSNTITFSKVSGFTTPSAVTYVMTGDEAIDVVWGVYNDTSDPGDDYTSGTIPGSKKKYAPVKISPSAKGASVLRSLFKEDCADWFSFSGTAGVYYKFALTGKTADAIVRVYDPGDLENPLPNVLNKNPDAWQVLIEKKGTYYVCVTHADEDPSNWEDDGYTMTATSVNVGTIKLAKTEISVKDNVAYAELTVNRSSGDGMVRVKWETEDGTAKDRSEYYAASGVLKWENGDKKAQKISIRLLPEETANFWKPDSKFKVNLSLYPEDEIDTLAGEYIPALLTPTATVTVKSSGKKTPGTVSVIDCRVDDFDEIVDLDISGKSHSVTVLDDCGEIRFELARFDGCNGDVAVRAQTQKGTLKDGEFDPVDETFVWKDGDCTNRFTVTVKVDPLVDPAVVTKNFKLKLTAVKKGASGEKYESVKIGMATVTVNLRNNLVEETAEELAKTLDKSDGLVLKAAKAGTWYVDSKSQRLQTVELSGSQKAELTFTLTGPGLFKVTPKNVSGTGKFECKIGKESPFAVGDGEEIVRLVPAGSTAIKFSAACEPTCSPTFVAGFAAAYGEYDVPCSYFWMPLKDVAATEPKDKATVLPAAERQTFRWTVPAKAAESGIRYRLTLAEKAKDLGTGAAKILTTALTESEFTYVGALDANKTYYWRVDYRVQEGSSDWIVPKTSWSFKTCAADGVVPAVVEGQTDAYGSKIDDELEFGYPVNLVQGVKVDIALADKDGGAALTYALASGKLPDGVKLVADKKTGLTSIKGVPTKVGKFPVLVQAKNGKTAGATMALLFVVNPIGNAAGTFYGVLPWAVEGASPETGLEGLAAVTFTASEKGALSAKVQIAGKSYTFKDTGYEKLSDDEAFCTTLFQVQKVGGVPCTNELEISISGSDGETKLRMRALSTDKTVKNLREWSGEIDRDGTKSKDVLEDLQRFVGYYTVALSPTNACSKAHPSGNGYLTVTVDAKGKAKVSGKLADGTAISGSVTPTLTDDNDALKVPLYFVKGKSLFGGTMRMIEDTAFGPIVCVVDSSSTLYWSSDDPNATYEGKDGFRMEVIPTGGYYDTLLNLQRYYLDYKFLLDVSDDLPSELFAAGYGLAEYGLPNEEKPLEMLLAGNTPTVGKCALAKIGKTKLYDLGASVNPWNVKLTFKRATGILSGSLSVWSETADGLAQKEIKSLKHEGVLLLNRGESPLADNVWTAGYYLAPATLKKTTGSGTRKWNCSLPFNITFEPPVL